MLSLGYNFRIPVEDVIAIVAVNSAPIKRMIASARDNDQLHDCTKGKKTRSAIVTVNQDIYLSAFTADSLSNRLQSAYLMSKVVNDEALWLSPDHQSKLKRANAVN